MDKDLKERIDRIKGSKFSEKEKKRLIGLAREDAREERKIQRASRDDRLKMLCGRYIDLAVDFAKELGERIGCGQIREGSRWSAKDLKKQTKFGLTTALKRYKVLPLKG